MKHLISINACCGNSFSLPLANYIDYEIYLSLVDKRFPIPDRLGNLINFDFLNNL